MSSTSQFSERARVFLQEKRFAVLATLQEDGTPQLTTMWYLLAGDIIVLNTKAGRFKDRNVRRDPRVALCWEDGYNYLSANGIVELIDDPQTTQHDIYRLAKRYHGDEIAQQQMAEMFSKEQRVTLRVTCQHIIERLD
jgi:PPOX class probable F420-dependent enzyme